MRLRPVIPVTSKVVPAVLAGFLLAGCGGSISPGAAAVVDGTTISMDQADRAAVVFCQVSLFSSAQAGGGTVDNADVRRQAVAELVSGAVAEELAEREDIMISPSDYEFTRAQRDQVAQALPDVDLDEAVRVLEAGQRTYAIAERLGVAETGEQVTPQNEGDVQQAGRAVLADAVKAADVSIDPRFGLGDDGQQVAATGSLSVSSDVLNEDAQLVAPATQRCS